jgi:hypothetical protein
MLGIVIINYHGLALHIQRVSMYRALGFLLDEIMIIKKINLVRKIIVLEYLKFFTIYQTKLSIIENKFSPQKRYNHPKLQDFKTLDQKSNYYNNHKNRRKLKLNYNLSLKNPNYRQS